MEPFLGELRIVAFPFAPKGWALCHGQLLPINQNQALFALLGTQYGGNGQTTFALPDLRGRVPIGHGQGPGLTLRHVGELGGAETHTLTTHQMPNHGHGARANTSTATRTTPSGNYPAGGGAYGPAPTAGTLMHHAMVTLTGGGQPHNNVQPSLALNYIIALQGVFPSQS